jgi:adenylate cyclase
VTRAGGGRVYSGLVETFDLDEAAARAGLPPSELSRLVELGVITPLPTGRFAAGHLRRASMVRSLVASGISLEGLAAAIERGAVSLAFLDAPAFERFSALGGATFQEIADDRGIPVHMLLAVREAAGSPAASPADRIREDELVYADLIKLAIGGGLREPAMLQMARTQGDNLRRLAETESAIWKDEIIEPALRAGIPVEQVLGGEFGDHMSELTERALIAMYHLQQARAWTGDIIDGLEAQLAAAGLHSRLERPPAMCFLDITGYTRLTQEHGDAAAAELATTLGQIVQRESIRHGGRPVKWLGDGVMLHYQDPARAVVGALDLVRAVADGGLPPAHVGLHAGPVIFQAGDYYGSTVNLASRIADKAGPGRVFVSQSVIDHAAGAPVRFMDVGRFELKGVAEPMPLFEVTRASPDERRHA